MSCMYFVVSGEKEYYERQFATLKSFEEVDSHNSSDVIDEELDRQEQAQQERAMNISNWANVFLLAFKVNGIKKKKKKTLFSSCLLS